MIDDNHSLVGFNNIGFDYPVVHKIIEARNDFINQPRGLLICKKIYKWAQEQIESMRGEFANTVKQKIGLSLKLIYLRFTILTIKLKAQV